MTQNGGEKELILGNKQLISLFFVVVALCGVFFAMGYMVRGNSLKGSMATVEGSVATEGTGSVKRQQPEPPRETVDPSQSPAVQPALQPPTETHPADDAGASSAAPAVDSQSPLKAGLKADSRPVALEAGAQYIQVVALPLADAESTARTLREQHLPASVATSSKEGLFRVLVGPYRETGDIADAKGRLKALGFSNTIVQKQ
jgi:cell division septation protein DedD